MSNKSIQWTIRDYLQIILHRKWLFIVPLIAALLVALVVARVLPRVFRSYGVILIEEKRVSNPLIEHIAVSRSIGDKIAVVRSKILSQGYMEQLVKDMQLDVDYNNPAAMASAINELRRQIQVYMPQPQMIRVVCEREDPREAKDITDYVIDRLMEENLKLQKWEVDSALDFINAQLDIYDKRLEHADIFIHGLSDLMSLPTLTQSSEQNIGLLQALPSVMNVDAQKLIKFESNLIEIGIEKKLTEEKLEKLQGRMSREDGEYVLHAAKENDPILAGLISELYSKQARLDALLVDSTEEHPAVIKLRQEIALLSSQVEGQRQKRIELKDYELNPAYRELQADVEETELDLKQLEMKEQEYEKWATKYREKLEEIPSEQLKRFRLMRDYAVDLNIYTLLKQKRETALLTQRLDIDEKGNRFQLLEPPQVPLGPIRPNVSMIIFLGTLMGACVGGGLIFASEFADHSFRDVTEARRHLDLPILGSISYIDNPNRGSGWGILRKLTGVFAAAVTIMKALFTGRL